MYPINFTVNEYLQTEIKLYEKDVTWHRRPCAKRIIKVGTLNQIRLEQ